MASNANTYFDPSHNVVDDSSTQPNLGWYMNLPNTGERLIYPFELRQNRALIVDTISPANVSFDPCLQTTGGTGFTYVLDSITGQGPSTPIFDTNGDGNIDSNDLVAAGFQTSADGKNKTIGGESNASSSTYFNCSADSPTCTKFKLPCEFTNTCVTTTTTTVPQIESREWRQLFMR